MKQAPQYFFKHLTDRLKLAGYKQSQFDPCLFHANGSIIIFYVDDLLIYGWTDNDINTIISRVNELGITLNRKGTAEGFLGIDIHREGNKTTLSQPGLTKRIIEELGLCSKNSTPTQVPAGRSPLSQNTSAPAYEGPISYGTIIGMLLYLTGHSHPDIAFAVHQCAQYTFEPTDTHVTALRCIGRYLKDFAGLWGYKDSQDPHCIHSCTGYVITLCGCPVLWTSKLQTEIALSTMEAEYVALSTACKDLFPIMDILKEFYNTLGLQTPSQGNLHVRIHKDNVGALTLGQLEPRRMTPRSKHYAVKYHWFRNHIGP